VIAGWQIDTTRSTAPRRQTTIRLAWPLAQAPSARVVRAIVRATGWRGGLSFLGRVKRTWTPNLLLLDYDGDALPTITEICRRLAVMNLHCQLFEQHRTRHGWHVILHVRQRLTLPEAIAAQAILGSDPFREGFNLARARSRPGAFWRQRANLLFEGKLR
jgi:hypothetical protein